MFEIIFYIICILILLFWFLHWLFEVNFDIDIEDNLWIYFTWNKKRYNKILIKNHPI